MGNNRVGEHNLAQYENELIRNISCGHFEAIPVNIDWNDVQEAALLISFYDLDGTEKVQAETNRLRAIAERTREWDGTALELWRSLFGEQRRQRFNWGGDEPAQLEFLNLLVRAWRASLIATSAEERAKLIELMKR